MTKHATALTAATLLATALPGCSAEARYQRIVNHTDAPGAQLAVHEPGGGRWFGAGGEADDGVDMTTDHLLLIGSNTKVWTAAVTLSMVDEGLLRLDDTAAAWLPELHEQITIRDLLQHTSGMGEYFEHPSMEGHRGDEWAPETLVALGQEVRDDGPTPTAVYANTNFIALGLVIEAIEGRPYRESLQARVLDPLELERSGLAVSGEALPEALAMGDGGIYDRVTPEDPSVGWSAGAGYSTAEELAEFYAGMWAGELYSRELVEEQLRSVEADLGFDEELETWYGLGLMVVGIGDQTVVGHLGTVEGFNALSVRDEETGALAVVLTNSSEVVAVDPAMKALGVAGGE